MMMRQLRGLLAVPAVLAALFLAGCERPDMDTAQIGYRGTGMEKVTNPRIVAASAAKHVAPAPLDPVPAAGPKARDVYKNVKLLGDLSIGEFNRLMVAMTQWIAPNESCAYCHNLQNFADDSVYTKNTARKMLQMTWEINSKWKAHVADTGVTCYTCHRGQGVPAERWFADPPMKTAGRMLGNDNGQNKAGKASVGNASLPYDPFTPFLLGKQEIRVTAPTALPTGHDVRLKQAEWTHGLMIHMSESLGVGCVQCHNSRAFAEWNQSPPQRVTAWHGIRMVRNLNNDFMVPLTAGQPKNRLGPSGDIAKVNCATCHQGVNKPLNGASMVKAHPELMGPPQAPTKTSLATQPGIETVLRVVQ